MSKTPLRMISSMATRELLAALAAEYGQRTGQQVDAQAAGGVDVAKRVEQGEVFDVVVLASNAIDKLMASGKVVQGSRRDLVESGVAMAVRAGAARPPIGTEEEVKAAVLAAPTLSYSNGPSGVYPQATRSARQEGAEGPALPRAARLRRLHQPAALGALRAVRQRHADRGGLAARLRGRDGARGA